MSLNKSLDAVLEAAVLAGDVPGVVAGLTTADATVYEGGFGERAIGGGVAMTSDTVGWIASMTKAITAAAAMQLVEEGRLDLDGPASAVVPYLSTVTVLEGFDGAGQPLTRPPKRPVTLRHLLTHTAGFGYDVWNPDIERYMKAMGLPRNTTGKDASLTTPLTFDPGDRWQYGISIDWAGKMVEAVSGQKLGQYLKENIFDPLGMDSTGFKITPAMADRRASVHRRDADGRFEALDMIVEQNPEFEAGGGGLYSTVGDYLKFIRMVLGQGTGNGIRVLRSETVAMMSVNQMGDCRVSKLETAKAELSNDVEFFPGLEKTWGLSFLINERQASTGRSAGSLAWGGLANSYFWIDPAKGIGGAYLTQILPFGDETSLPLFEAFEKTTYQGIR